MDEKTIKKLLGQRIKQLRKKKNLTQFAIGEIMGIDQRQIAYIEGGNCFPTLKTLNKFTVIFECSIKDLFDFEHFMVPVDIDKKLDEKLSKCDLKTKQLCYSFINTLENNS